MTMNWVDASLSFPTFPRFCGQTFLEREDKELADLCVKAYNDWMVDEWCGDSRGRLIPLTIVPLAMPPRSRRITTVRSPSPSSRSTRTTRR